MNLEEISKTHIFKSSYTKLGDINVNARNLIEVSLCGYEQMKTIYQYTYDHEIIHVEWTQHYSKEKPDHGMPSRGIFEPLYAGDVIIAGKYFILTESEFRELTGESKWLNKTKQ